MYCKHMNLLCMHHPAENDILICLLSSINPPTNTSQAPSHSLPIARKCGANPIQDLRTGGGTGPWLRSLWNELAGPSPVQRASAVEPWRSLLWF